MDLQRHPGTCIATRICSASKDMPCKGLALREVLLWSPRFSAVFHEREVHNRKGFWQVCQAPPNLGIHPTFQQK